MNLKINIKARLQRHSRNVTFFKKRKTFFKIIKKFKFISLLIILILPIYPSFGAIWVEKEYAVWNYDESTILTAYEWDSESKNSNIFSQDSWFIKPSNAIDSDRDMSWVNYFVYHTIQSWDTISTIAEKFHVSSNSILWSNDFWNNKVLKPWDTIKIPPVSWIAYTVSPNDTLDSISAKYSVDKINILSQNQIDASEELKIGQQLILPWATKPEPPKPVIVQPRIIKPVYVKNSNWKLVAVAPKNTVPLKSWYEIKYTGKWSRFAYGNCTYYVANHKNVTWRWNANQWLNNARAAWVPTGQQATPWAIVSFGWGWYNPYYGHVWIVSEVWDDYIIVKDMNYRRFNEVTVRKVSKYDKSIKWYIYTN